MKRRGFIIIASLFSLAPGYISYSQKILYPVSDPVYTRWDNFNIMDGNGGSNTSSLIQDRKGFIWAGNQAGLYRFDGKIYKRFGLGEFNDSTLAGIEVLSIFEDSEGTIWAGTFGALNRIDKRLNSVRWFIPDTTDPANLNNSVRLINEDSHGLLWLITDQNIFKFDRKSEIFTEFPIAKSVWHPGRLYDKFEEDRYLEDDSARIWIATDDGLYIFDHNDGNWRKVFPVPSEQSNDDTCRINCVEKDRNGNIWCGTEKYGLIRIVDSETGAFEQISLNPDGEDELSDKEIGIIYIDTTGLIWACGKGSIYKFNSITGERSYYKFPDEFMAGSKKLKGTTMAIRKILPGNDGSLWLFVPGTGVLFHWLHEKEIIKSYNIPRYVDFNFIEDNAGCFWTGSIDSRVHRLVADSLPFVSIKAEYNPNILLFRCPRIIEDNQGVIRLALLKEGLWYLLKDDYRTFTGIGKSTGAAEGLNIMSLFEDSGGNLWFGCFDNSIIKYSVSDNYIMKYQLPVKIKFPDDNRINVIQEDSQGNIYICHTSYGLFIIEGGKKTIKPFLSWYELTDVQEGFCIMDFVITERNEVWIATMDGLYKTDINKTGIKDYSGFDGSGFGYSMYNRISRDPEGNIWILNTTKGPYKFNPENETFSRIILDEEFYGIYFTDLNFDKYGNLWLTQSKSVIIVDPLTHSTRKIDTFQEENAAVSSLRTRSGEMIYLVDHQIYIYPARVPMNRFVPPVYMTGLYINGIEYHDFYPEDEPVADLRKIMLSHKQNHLKLEFAALNYLNPENNRYRYFMDGIDPDTSGVVSDMSAEYRKMNPGSYKFWFTGSNNDGIWNPSGKTLEIRILPPWYRSAVAYVIYVLILAGGIFGYIRLRTMRLRKDKIRLEREVRQRTAELEIKNRQLAEIDETKTKFFTDVSHEIRTPLTLILGPLESLKKEHYDDEKQEKLLDIMRRNGQRLMQLVNQLLDISKLDSGNMKILLSEGDIVKDLSMLVYEFLSLAESKNINYIVEIPKYGFNTLFDRDKTEKIVSNLLSNAFKFTPVNGTVRCVINIQGEDGDQPELEVRVRDSGPGMLAERIENIFDRFYSIETHHEKETIGTGIGLALTKEFLTLLHGTIDVTSTPGVGSEFTVRLPLGEEHLREDEYTLMEEVTEPDKDFHKKPLIVPAWEKIKSSIHEEKNSILIIEDNTDLRTYIRENLSDDYNVLEAEDGIVGLNLAMTMIPDVIITDLMMPGMDGITLCTRIKGDERTSHIPVIMLTAKATQEDRISGLKTGADDYIIKPFNMEELSVRLKNLLTEREKLRIKFRNEIFMEKVSDEPLSLDDRFMGKVYKTISEHIRDFDFDTDYLHRYLGMSRGHLYRKIKAMTGLSTSILIRNFRMEKAGKLLSGTRGNITEVANSVGISNPSYFTRCFREYFGVSPKDFSKQVR